MSIATTYDKLTCYTYSDIPTQSELPLSDPQARIPTIVQCTTTTHVARIHATVYIDSGIYSWRPQAPSFSVLQPGLVKGCSCHITDCTL